MNWFTKFWHHLLNPHCADCAREAEYQEEIISHCDTCEALKQELAIAHQDYRFLLEKMTAQPTEPVVREPPIISKPLVIPWKTKQQMLEKEDRIKAAAMRGAGKSTDELEKELIS